jgi:hypothetical protein
MPHAEDSVSYTNEGSMSGSVIQTEDRQNDNGLRQPSEPLGSQGQSSFAEAQQRRKIAELENKVVALESGRAVKDRYALSFCVHCVYLVHRLLGSQITIWPKDEASGVLWLYSTILRILSMKTIGGMMAMAMRILLSSTKLSSLRYCEHHWFYVAKIVCRQGTVC